MYMYMCVCVCSPRLLHGIGAPIVSQPRGLASFVRRLETAGPAVQSAGSSSFGLAPSGNMMSNEICIYVYATYMHTCMNACMHVDTCR